jgi:cytosine deaminase
MCFRSQGQPICANVSRCWTERSARLLNLKDYGLAVGNPADIVVIDAETPEQAVAEVRQPLAVYKRGRRTVIRHPPELVRLGNAAQHIR